MNAAARLLNQGELSRGWVVSVFFARFHLTLFVLLVVMLSSALSLVYVTNYTRNLNAHIQQAMVEQDRLVLQYSQLLLEKSTLLMQARVEDVAQNKLKMVMPTNKTRVMIDEE